jgi:hypothetical protein
MCLQKNEQMELVYKKNRRAAAFVYKDVVEGIQFYGKLIPMPGATTT